MVMLRGAQAQVPQLTTIQDVIYRANGEPAAGSVVISWPAFTTADNRAVAAGRTSVAIGAGGFVMVALAPNEGAQPAGSYYKIVYKLNDGTTATEFWTVPLASPATIGAIRTAVAPATVAAQFVSRQYVDNLVLGNDAAVVHRAGAETITGVKTFNAQLVSTVPPGAAPIAVASSTKVTNLNADQVDGIDSAALLPRPNSRRWSYTIANGTGSFNVIGDTATATGSCGAPVTATNTDPPMTDCSQSTATINTTAGISGSSGMWRTGRNLSLQWTGRLRETASVRAWVGLSDQTLSTMVSSDNPAGNYAGFRYSTSAGDTNVKCVTKDGTTQNVQATTLADLSTTRNYEITEESAGGRWHFFVDGTEVCGGGLTSNLPLANTNLRYMAGQQNLISSVRNLDIAWVQITADK